MCARFFILIICVIAAYVTITVAAFIYLDWWQAILVSALTLVLIVLSIKYLVRYFVGSLAKFAKGLLEGKSRVLRNAAADVHSVKPGAPPPAFVEVVKISTGDVEHVVSNLAWHTVEATIFPDAGQASGMTHWDVDDLRLVPIDAEVPTEAAPDETYGLYDVQLVENGEARPLGGPKLLGPRRLRFTVGVPAEMKSLQFRYYFEQFGRIDLPAPLRLRT